MMFIVTTLLLGEMGAGAGKPITGQGYCIWILVRNASEYPGSVAGAGS